MRKQSVYVRQSSLCKTQSHSESPVYLNVYIAQWTQFWQQYSLLYVPPFIWCICISATCVTCTPDECIMFTASAQLKHNALEHNVTFILCVSLVSELVSFVVQTRIINMVPLHTLAYSTLTIWQNNKAKDCFGYLMRLGLSIKCILIN